MADPVSLDDAKLHLRIDAADTDQDSYIEGLIPAAVAHIENYTGRPLTQRGFVQNFDCFGLCLDLFWQPAVSVQSLTFTDVDGVQQTLDPSGYVAMLNRNPPRIFPPRDGWWPQLGQYGQVTINYTAGYADDQVPRDLVHAVFLMIGHLFANREENVVDARLAAIELPLGIKSLCAPYRRVAL